MQDHAGGKAVSQKAGRVFKEVREQVQLRRELKRRREQSTIVCHHLVALKNEKFRSVFTKSLLKIIYFPHPPGRYTLSGRWANNLQRKLLQVARSILDFLDNFAIPFLFILIYF